MEQTKAIVVVWSYFLAVLAIAIFSVLFVSNVLPTSESGEGLISTPLERYLLAVIIAACGGWAVDFYRKWRTGSALRYICLLFAFIAFYHAASFVVVFSPPVISTWINVLVLCLMAAIMVQHYFFSKPS